MIVYLNGKFIPESKAVIPITDHGFLYGDGVYETIRVYKGKPFLLSRHLLRLNDSLRGIHLLPPISLIQLGMIVQKTIDANKHKDAAVRIIITRGPGPHGFDPTRCLKPTVLITSTPRSPHESDVYKKGIIAAVVSVRRNNSQALPPSIKSTSCLNGILAKIEATQLGAQEGLMLRDDLAISEGTVSNVFIVKKHTILTPELDGFLLPGVTREWVCQLAREAWYKVEEKRLILKDLVHADEVFLTSTLMEIVPVKRLIFNHNGEQQQLRLGPYSRTSGHVGPVTLDLMNRFSDSLQKLERM
jgi:branched-chain amino acid aminotransferase